MNIRVRRLWSAVLPAAVTAGLIAPLSGIASAAPAETPWTISTYAGNGQPTGPVGDGGPAKNAVVDTPSGIAKDTAGNVYVAEYWSSRVRKIAPNGVITTVAGTGVFGSSGDGGPATQAQLGTPSGIAVDDWDGSIYIADALHAKVRKVDPQGIISTFAGDGRHGFAGDGGPATSARLNDPTGLAVDPARRLHIADTNNNRIRKVHDNGVITTVLGTGVAGTGHDQLNHPRGVAAAFPGWVAVADTGNNRVQLLLVVAGHTARTVAGSGSGVAGSGRTDLRQPQGVGFDTGENLYVADTGNNRVQVISQWERIRQMAGAGPAGFTGDGGPATVAQMNTPVAVAVATGESASLFIADQENHRVRRVAVAPLITRVAGTGYPGQWQDGILAWFQRLDRPSGIVRDAAGNIIFGDSRNKIGKISPDGIITTVATFTDWEAGSGIAQGAMTMDRHGNLFIGGHSAVFKIDPQGQRTVIAGRHGDPRVSGDGGPATAATMSDPTGIAVDPAGNIYIATPRDARIRKVDTNGIITTFAGTGTAGYSGDGGPAASAQLNMSDSWYPNFGTVAADSAGNVYIGDSMNFRIRKVGTNRIISTVAGTGRPLPEMPTPYQPDGRAATSIDLAKPASIGVDPAGRVYFADRNSIRRFGPDGIVRTVAGLGMVDDGRETRQMPCDRYHHTDFPGSPAALAELPDPTRFAFDSGGTIYFTESLCHMIRKITVS